jgi:hypothetical protein
MTMPVHDARTSAAAGTDAASDCQYSRREILQLAGGAASLAAVPGDVAQAASSPTQEAAADEDRGHRSWVPLGDATGKVR